MKKFALLLILLTTFASTQTLPQYDGVNTSTTPVGPITSPFNTGTLYNSVAYSPLNPTTNPITRLTDQLWSCNTVNATQLSQGNLTASMGDNDKMASLHGTYIGVHASGANCILHIALNGNGELQNVTNGGENGFITLPGMMAFSQTVDNEVYYLVDSHVLHRATITSDTAYTDEVIYDFDSCPATGVAPGTKAQSASIIGISENDNIISINISWTGGQGTSHLMMAYSQSRKQCASLDLAPNGATSTFGYWYAFGATSPSGTETACVDPNYAIGKGIHDSNLSGDGTIMMAAGAAFLAHPAPGNSCFWQVGTANITSDSGSDYGMGGHESLYGKVLVRINNPTPNVRTVSPLTPCSIANFTPLNTLPVAPGGPGGYHGGSAHPLGTDALPLFIESAGSSKRTSYLNPDYLQNEVFAVSMTPGAPILRYGLTYNSGTSKNPGCGYGIGFPSQDGTRWFFLSDGFLNLGLDSTGNPLCSLFGIVLGKN